MSPGERGLWALVGAAVVHVAEEYLLDWRAWVGSLSGLDLSWVRFGLINAAFLAFAATAAAVGWRSPRFSLALPCLVLINAVCVHIGPSVAFGRLSPGVITSVLLYVPIGSWALWQAGRSGVATVSVLGAAAAIAVGLMVLPVLLALAG